MTELGFKIEGEKKKITELQPLVIIQFEMTWDINYWVSWLVATCNSQNDNDAAFQCSNSNQSLKKKD